ncbi:YiiX/YebB-like N1pC/P60 family cysteine hydrolase [Tamlana crocina]|uniref:Permuted papain-like amidase YaeF/Yiix C92 family enzyme n=1 Tax=Tamlana crocina TaxID=393006 RepID=A0ABX1DCN2_9FLAO|nr:YiiX/YebB-like N1pC/P60 family cysteine hydrolase [Tamlana crocina]NJX15409.1 hypothetical protein [Tamlana crocina]
MKFSILPLVLLLALQIHAQDFELKPGDLIFQTIDCGPLCNAINEVTEGYKGNDFNHVGMVVGQSGKLLILEASGAEVKLTEFNDFAKKSHAPMYLGRLKKRFRKFIPAAISFGLEQLGTPYDDAYVYNNGKYYCSELIYDCFLDAKGKPLFKLYPMTYKSPDSDEFFQVWEDYFNDRNLEIPEGQPGCNPGGMSLSNKIKILGTI